jgi:hypothetical protein
MAFVLALATGYMARIIGVCVARLVHQRAGAISAGVVEKGLTKCDRISVCLGEISTGGIEIDLTQAEGDDIVEIRRRLHRGRKFEILQIVERHREEALATRAIEDVGGKCDAPLFAHDAPDRC